ncbi:hypothetical protein [Streptomyces hygroscopicus]|nr:hypothetical protein [Streptomyces hygroscopicus]
MTTGDLLAVFDMQRVFAEPGGPWPPRASASGHPNWTGASDT